MKRFLLVSLMCSMLVGQISCEWSWGNFAKGAAWTALGSMGWACLTASSQDQQDTNQNRFQENFRFNVGENASAYIGSSLAGFAAINYLNNPDAARQFCGYDNTSGFAGVLSASALLWAGTHGTSLINFLRRPRQRFCTRNQYSFSSWNLNDFTKGALETTKDIVSGGVISGIGSTIFGSKSSFLENAGYNLGSSSCNLMRRNATGIGALTFGRADIAQRRYGGTSGSYFAGGIAASSVLSLFVACVVMDNYYIKPVIKKGILGKLGSFLFSS